MAELFLVRHAQASLGSDNYDHLSHLGFQQAAVLAEYFKDRNVQFDAFVSGDMLRHKQTIAPIADDQVVRHESAWNEFDFEALIAAFLQQTPEAYVTFNEGKSGIYKVLRWAMKAWAKGQIDAPLPETWAAFQARVGGASQQIASSQYKKTLVVSSGGAIASFIGAQLKLSPEHIIDLNLQIRNASVHHFYFNTKGFQLSSFNSISHFDKPALEHFITYS